MSANQAQRDLWNAESQAILWPRRERITENVTEPLLRALALRPGERVLDIGCGGGLAALAAAKAVAPSGTVTGFDISAPLLKLATERAAAAKADNVRFLAGDAQVDAIDGAPFDAVMSQFGVMFFADPVAAFENIRRHMRPGGRIAFACWQPAAKNGWFPGPVIAPYQQPPPPTSHGGPPPGPFAFADVEHVRGVLSGAGFREIRHEEIVREVAVPEDTVIDRETVEGMRLDAEKTEQAWRDLQAFKATLVGADGLLHLRLAPQIFSARNP